MGGQDKGKREVGEAAATIADPFVDRMCISRCGVPLRVQPDLVLVLGIL
jgi:hypothetical protein